MSANLSVPGTASVKDAPEAAARDCLRLTAQVYYTNLVKMLRGPQQDPPKPETLLCR